MSGKYSKSVGGGSPGFLPDKNLEFEEAAKIRDEIRKLESTELEITLNPKIRQYDVKNKLYPKGRSTMGMPGTKVTKKKDKKWKHRG